VRVHFLAYGEMGTKKQYLRQNGDEARRLSTV
jgi:hypothetical protein